MSSHHIVREKQEPALLIFSIQGFNDEYLGQLLEWSPTLIVSENVYDELILKGIKVDFVLSEGNTIDKQEHTEIILANHDPLQAALLFLISRGYPAVNFITDEFLQDHHEAYSDKINQVVFTGDKRIFSISSGFSKWKPKDERIDLMNIREGIKTEGLIKIAVGSFITEKDGFYSIEFEGRPIFISEDY